MAGIVSAEVFSSLSYDCMYLGMPRSNLRSPVTDVIAGGGTAGLTLANRLTENPEITVAVLEAVGLLMVAAWRRR